MPFFRSALPVILCLSLASSAAVSQQTPNETTSASHAGMTNDDVIALASAGLSDEVIIAKIKGAPTVTFDTSVAGLKALKAGGISNTVIRFILDPTAPPVVAPAVAASAPPPPPNPDDPTTSHAPGIYILAKGADGETHLRKLDHTVPKSGKTSNMALSGFSYGLVKAHYKVLLDGAKASTEITDTNPTFYAYIPEDNTTFGGSSISVKDFALVMFDVKGDARTVNTASFSAWGSSFGTDEKARQGFTYDVLRPGIYKLALLKPLPPGEYAFQQSGAKGSSANQQNTGAYFDFGVLSGQ